jgi:hypothetical protein
VQFVEGHTQGCPSGSPLTMLSLHLAMHITLSKFPHIPVMLAIVDDIKSVGSIKDNVLIYFELKTVLNTVFGVYLNHHKSALLALQLHTVVDPVSDLASVYQ